MRVITGKAKGRKLLSPLGDGIRPTADRIKEDIFNILAGRVQGCHFLDLFSGSGAMGIEALSRGAEKCIFVEKNDTAYIEKNLTLTNLSSRAAIYKMDAQDAILRLQKNGESFHIIFMDPPYQYADGMKILRQIYLSGILEDSGVIVYEYSSKIMLPDVNYMNIMKEKKYNATKISFFTGLPECS